MRVRHILEGYRTFAARTHRAMAIVALGLVFAIIVLMVVSAVPSQAGFLAAEAKNVVPMPPTSDMLGLTVALVFLAVLVIKLLDRQTPTQ